MPMKPRWWPRWRPLPRASCWRCLAASTRGSATPGASFQAAIEAAVRALQGTLTIVIIGHRGALWALATQTISLDHGLAT